MRSRHAVTHPTSKGAPPMASPTVQGPAAPDVTDTDARADSGFVLVMLGLMIIPIMIFAALAVDVSSYYSRTAQLQKASDAASLAAVIWMPNVSRANQVATETMAKNGFTTGVDNISIAYLPGVDGPNTYRVVATDTKAKSYFAQVFFKDNIRLDRGATATVDPPLEMGSPLNYFGGDATDYPSTPAGTTVYNSPQPDSDSPPDTTVCYYRTGSNRNGTYGYRYNNDGSTSYIYFPSNWSNYRCKWSVSTPAVNSPILSTMNPGFWAAVEAPYTDAVQGDKYSGNCYGQGGTSCIGNGYSNPVHRNTGYLYTIKMPANPAPYVVVQLFDISWTNRGQTDGTGDNDLNGGNGGTSWYTHARMHDTDATPYDPTDNPLMSAASCGGSPSSTAQNSGNWTLQAGQSQQFKDKWMTLCTITAPAPGAIYTLQVYTTGTNGNASNNYAIRAIGTPNAASVDANNLPTTVSAQAAQPNLAAYQDMSMYNNLSTGQANFYLAKVPGQYAGRTLDIELYDPGDGTGITTQINTPSGIQKGCTYQSFRLRNISGGQGADGGSISSQVPLTTIGTGSNCSFATSGRFNGNSVIIKVPIPVTYTCDETVKSTWWSPVSPDSSGCWWSVTFNSNGAHDNTTWSVSVEGDPVRLTE